MKQPKKVIQSLMKQAEHNDNINELLQISQQIAGWMVYVSTLETDAFKLYQQANYSRKMFEAKFVRDSSESVAKASSLAIIESEELRSFEVDHESEHKQWQVFRIAVSEYLESLRQRISYLKQEAQTQRQTT